MDFTTGNIMTLKSRRHLETIVVEPQTIIRYDTEYFEWVVMSNDIPCKVTCLTGPVFADGIDRLLWAFDGSLYTFNEWADIAEVPDANVVQLKLTLPEAAINNWELCDMRQWKTSHVIRTRMAAEIAKEIDREIISVLHGKIQ